MSDDMDRLDKFQNAATRKKEQKEEKHRRRRETMGYIICLIWEVFRLVLYLVFFVLLAVSPFIAGEKLGIVAKIVISIVSSWILLTIFKKAFFDKSEKIRINDFFNEGTIIFNLVAYFILAIIYLYCKIVYHI